MNRLCFIAVLLMFVACKKETPNEPPKVFVPEAAFRTSLEGMKIDSQWIISKNNLLLIDLYKRFGYRAIWSDSIHRQSVVNALLKAGEDGLNPEDYDPDAISLFESQIGKVPDKDLAEFDMRISLTLQKFLIHLSQGKINPRNLYWNWDLRRHRADVNSLIESGVKADSLPGSIASVAPPTANYKNLKRALTSIDNLPEDKHLPKIHIGGKIQRGDTSRVVVKIKKRLKYWNDLKESEPLSGIYDDATFEAVRRFQKRHGLQPDGIIGKATASALNVSKGKRREQIIVNLERWRWFPRSFGSEYVLVNIPDFTLSIIKNGDTIARNRIIVGKSDRRTPILSSTFSRITLNPTWTVPPTILREDLIPSATANRNYFSEKSIKILDAKGREIAPSDWMPDKANRYRYVQSPGNHNALGNVKFDFPNRFTVYLHDTNARSHFQQSYRSLSSGCVRVENPLEIAEYMLGNPKRWPLDSIESTVASSKTVTLKIPRRIRIHQLYWTAWLEGDDMHFRDDVYDLDHKLYLLLRE